MGDSSINFVLRVWTDEYINKPLILKSLLYFEIFKRFKKAGIEIPFPQRDLHIKNTDFKIQTS
jgi:small-conductance mechanosensitive channel